MAAETICQIAGCNEPAVAPVGTTSAWLRDGTSTTTGFRVCDKHRCVISRLHDEIHRLISSDDTSNT